MVQKSQNKKYRQFVLKETQIRDYTGKVIMAPPPPTPVVAPLIKLVVRVLTFICLLISLIILTTNTASVFINFNEFKLRFQDVKAYRYMLATIVIGIAYTLLQTAFTIYEATRENRIGGSSFLLFDFYGDKVFIHS